MHILCFTMPGCHPCNQLKPVLEELRESDEFEGAKWSFIDIKQEPVGPTMRQAYGVEKVPTIIAMSYSGVELGRHVGGSVSELLLMLKGAQRKSLSYGSSGAAALDF